MIIILEGCDGTGKSTLAEELRLATVGMVKSFGPPKRHPLFEYELPIEKHNPVQPLILDRFHLGEMVWPRFFGRKSEMTPEAFTHIEMLLQSRGAIIVHCTGSPRAVGSRLKPEDAPVLPQVGDLLEEFRVACRRSRLPVLDHSVEEPVDVHTVIETARERMMNALPALTVQGGRFIGSPRPTALLVGDTVGAPYLPHRAPFVPYPATSGAYLLRALKLVGLARGVAITNAFRPGGSPEPVVQLWWAMRKPPVVALGANAHRELRRQGVPHVRVDHPQYARRFRHSQLREYGESIVQATWQEVRT